MAKATKPNKNAKATGTKAKAGPKGKKPTAKKMAVGFKAAVKKATAKKGDGNAKTVSTKKPAPPPPYRGFTGVSYAAEKRCVDGLIGVLMDPFDVTGQTVRGSRDHTGRWRIEDITIVRGHRYRSYSVKDADDLGVIAAAVRVLETTNTKPKTDRKTGVVTDVARDAYAALIALMGRPRVSDTMQMLLFVQWVNDRTPDQPLSGLMTYRPNGPGTETFAEIADSLITQNDFIETALDGFDRAWDATLKAAVNPPKTAESEPEPEATLPFDRTKNFNVVGTETDRSSAAAPVMIDPVPVKGRYIFEPNSQEESEADMAFDAGPWFEQATDQAIGELAAAEWEGKEALAVAEFCKPLDARFGEFESRQHVPGQYLATIDSFLARAWVERFRPDLAVTVKLTCEEQNEYLHDKSGLV